MEREYAKTEFFIRAREKILRVHLETAPVTVCYMPSCVQNKLNGICGQTVRNYTVKVANASVGFSILPDEIAYIAGREQMPPGERLLELKHASAHIQEKFFGFVLDFALSV